MNGVIQTIAGRAARHYRLASQLYLERFDDEALLLVAGHDRLLTVNAAAANLFELAAADFADGRVTASQLAAWLAGTYDLPASDCRHKSRELLAFALRNRILLRPEAA